ncbi:hypothetical protein Tco_0995371 [Tanacetum coccineum]
MDREVKRLKQSRIRLQSTLELRAVPDSTWEREAKCKKYPQPIHQPCTAAEAPSGGVTITSTLRFRNVPNDVIKLMMFPYSLEGAAKTWENVSKTDERIDKLADQLSTLVEIVSKKVVTPAPVKAVEENCVTCGGAHAWYNCPATDNNQNVCATTGTYNQQAPPNRVSNQMAPPGFAPVQNQGELKNEIQTTIKNQQTALMSQNNAFQNTLQNNLQTMLNSFFQAQASPSGTLPSNTIPNPKGEMKAITTRSGVAYEGPSNPTKPSPKKVVELETEEIMDEEQNEFQESTAQIPPLVIPKPILKPEIPKTLPKSTSIPEPEIPKTVPKANIPYPSRRDNQKNREKASYQKEKIFQMFQDLRFDISFADALFLMPNLLLRLGIC